MIRRHFLSLIATGSLLLIGVKRSIKDASSLWVSAAKRLPLIEDDMKSFSGYCVLKRASRPVILRGLDSQGKYETNLAQLCELQSKDSIKLAWVLVPEPGRIDPTTIPTLLVYSTRPSDKTLLWKPLES